MRTRGGIVVVVAHRPSALAALDQVLVMRNGTMQAFGPRDEVLRKTLVPQAVPPAKPPPLSRSAPPARPAARPTAPDGELTMTETQTSRNLRQSMRRQTQAGLAVVVLLFGGFGVWAATTSLSGAVISAGQVVVESNVKKVQHPTGGIVGEIRVRDGDRVQTGDLVIRLDETVTRASLSMVSKQLDQFEARQARLVAERDSQRSINFPDALIARKDHADVAEVLGGERSLFEARRTAIEGQRAQLSERVTQLREEIRGLEAQAAAKRKQTGLINQELEGVDQLYKQNLVPITRLTSLQREASRLDGEEGQLVASIAASRGKIAETELQIIQLVQDLKREVADRAARQPGQDRRIGASARSRPRTSSGASTSAPRRTASCTSSPRTRSAASSMRASRSC